MEPISHQMQKLHLTKEERSPSPPKTKPAEILSLKVIKNHPYQSYKRQHHHLDKRSKTTQGSMPCPPILRSNKMLGGYGQECH
jgi:hypothetical protein